MPPKTSNKLILGLVLGLVALIIILIVVFAVVLNNNETPEPSISSDTASSSVSSEAPDSDSSALPVETENYTVGDVIFTIPVEWGPAFDDNGNLFMTPSADEFMVVYCFAGEADSFSYESYLESLAEDYSNYQHISFGEASFGGISGKLHTYNATLDLDYKISSFYFTIGDDLMCVQYMRSVALPDSREPMEDVLGTLRTAGNADTESATSPSSGSSSAPVQESYSDGIYAVGTDIPAGEYLLLPDAGFNASYEVKASPDQNGIDSVIDSGTFRARWYLTVEEGQYLTLSSCTMVPAGQAPEVDLSSGVLAEGMYLVGVDIPAGEYTLRSTHDYLGVFEVRSSSRVTDKDSTVIASGNFDDEAYVTVEDGQYLYVRGAEIELPQ